jgi:TRAP transporter 4TM/12TM fusion protein
MKKNGYQPHYAGAIEACAATGGTITPPIMGSAAFIMASFLNIPYLEIVAAATLPAILYYLGIFVQVDANAAKNGLKGLPKSELPSFYQTLKSGWYYIFALVILIYFLTILQSESQAPYYTSLMLIIIAMLTKQNRLTWARVKEMMIDLGKTLSEMTAIIAGVGFIVGAFSMTGVSFSFSRELVALAGENVLLILIAGAITSFLLGMGMTVSACYIFLAIIMAPALVKLGVEPIAAHFFVMYWATVSYITPPVALAAFAAAGIAKADAMQTGFTATRLGMVKYFVPFFLVYEPAIVAQASIGKILYTALTAIIGVMMIGYAFEKYFPGIGMLNNVVVRILILGGGFLLFFPGVITDMIGFVIALIVIGIPVARKYLLRQRENRIEREVS